jgi:hypothetical protein
MHFAIVGGSSNSPLMSDGPSLLWTLVAPVHVPRAPQKQRSSDVIEPIATMGGTSNAPLMSDGPLPLLVVVAMVR